MDAKTIGKNISTLRKKCDLTQNELAEKLGVSNKAVSRWESGKGYPDISFFPMLSEIFGVTIDYLMLGERKGITIAGNIIADIVKNIDVYPEIGMLTNINDISYAVGGCAANTSIDIAKIDTTLPVSVVGMVGNDPQGRYILSQLQKYNIDTTGILFCQDEQTSFCDVMSMPNGERTFFHKKGANAIFSPSDIDIPSLNCTLLHIGYILLLDRVDEHDEKYGTVMARFLHEVQKHGIKTSIDVVSSSDADYASKILPALKYTDYAIMNEIEACGAFGVAPYRADGTLNCENVIYAMRTMAENGVSDKVIVHSKFDSFILDVQSGQVTEVPSLKIPTELIKGSVGAGDAFCAGCLYGIYNGYSDRKILEFASAAAACNLFAANSVDGMRTKEEIEKICEKYERIGS